MRKFGKESTSPSEGVDRNGGTGWLQNHCALALVVVAVLALVLRTVFVYGVSAGAGFALSGGSEAQYHLHVVESILNGSFIFGTDAAINYPYGGLNVNPPLYDFIAAGLGALVSASTALAVLAPIFGALTVFPVYMIGKELGDYKTGFIAALIFGLMALPISSTVFSNGTEYAFVAFLFAIFTLAMIKVVRKVNANELAKKEVVIAGIIFGLIALSWNGFRAIIVMLIIIMVVQMLVDRFNSKDFSVTLYSYSLIMLIGVALAAIYYIPANLWDAVFSGPALITIIAIAFGFIFKAVQDKPWIFTVPALIVAFVVIAAVLFFVMPDLYTALIYGNPVFANEIMNDLVSTGISISKMSAYYGWILMWAPITLGLYTFYVYARKDRSHTVLFETMWLLVLWFFSWTSYAAAAIFGAVFAVASAIILVDLFRAADIPTWISNMRSAGFPGMFRKLIKPLPFLSVLVTALLIVAPGAVYAVDAGISSNEDYGYFAYGNTIFTVEEGDSYPYVYAYDALQTVNGTGAVVSWIDTASDLAARGFNAVNDFRGEGAAASAAIYMSNGSSGATAAQIVRIMMANSDMDFSSEFSEYSDLYDNLKDLIENPQDAKETIINNPESYPNMRSDMTGENAVYILAVEAIQKDVVESDIATLYNDVSSKAGERIGYYLLDGSMLPLMYGDGSSTSTLAYIAGYTTDSYGASPQFYSLMTYYQNYYPAMATDALYDTFLWKAIVGPSPSEAGYSSSFSYLYALSASNGSVKPLPTWGLDGYSVVSWFVKYNSNPQAEATDDGWKYMTAAEAWELQEQDGGLINYLSSIITLSYDGAGTYTQAAKVVNENGDPWEGISVIISAYNSVYETNVVVAETKTNANGEYSVNVPSGSYNVTYKSGDLVLSPSVDGTNIVVNSAEFEGKVTLGSEVDTADYLYVLKSGSNEYRIDSSNGNIYSTDAKDVDGKDAKIMPGVYSYELRDATATTVSSGTVTLFPGDNTGLTVTPKSYSVTATVNDFHGVAIDSATLVATNKTTGAQYETAVVDGSAVIVLPSASYTFSLTDGYITNNTTTLSVTAARTITITAYEAETISYAPANVVMTATSGSFSTFGTDGKISLPVPVGGTFTSISLYGADAKNVYYGLFEGGAMSFSTADALKVTGSIGAAGTVKFIASNGFTATATADDDGNFSILLGAGTYTVYAYNSDSSSAYLGTTEITDDVDLGKLALVDARKVTSTYQYATGTSTTNVGLPYAVQAASFTYDSKDWTITQISGTDGKSTFVIPDAATGLTVTANDGYVDDGVFKGENLVAEISDGTSDATTTITISRDNLYTQTISVPYKMTLTPYSGGDNIEFSGTMAIKPGQYTAKVDGSTGYYFSGKVYVYPGNAEFVGLNAVKVHGVTITKYDLDTITITGEKAYYQSGDIYYFEEGGEFYIKSANGSTGNVKFGYVDDTTPATLDMSTESKLMTITGYVGVVGDGELKVYYDDVVIKTDVSNGAFTVELPMDVTSATFTASVTSTIGSTEYGFIGTTEATGLEEGSIVNMAVTSSNSCVDYTSGNLGVRLDSASFNSGKASVGFTIFNNTDSSKVYAVTTGSAWTLDAPLIVSVDANSSKAVTAVGSYDTLSTGIGSLGMNFIVTDFNGTTTKTVDIVEGTNASIGTEVTMKTAKDSYYKDKIIGSEYLYALVFSNKGMTSEVKIDVVTDDGYSVVLMGADGAIIADSGSYMNVPASCTSVVYVKVMDLDGNMTTPPNVKVTTSYGDNVTLTPSTMEVEVESMTVSGDTAVDEKSGIPMGVWFIFGVSILVLILIVWMGSKRGVFSRK